jgi:DNA-binding transcriptional LysR family regulator
LLEAYEAYDRIVYAVYPHRRPLAGKLRAFLDHLADPFRTKPSQRADGLVRLRRAKPRGFG